jgi:hypothetical protein
MDQITARRATPAASARALDGIEVVLVAVGLFAVAEVLYNALYEGRVVETQNRLSRVHMTGRDWKRSMARLAARHGHRHAVWLHSGGRHRDSHLPELRHRERSWPSTEDRRVRHRAPSKAWPAPRPPTTPP